MCGRFFLDATITEINAVFGVRSKANLTVRYNIAPTQAIAAVRLGEDGERELSAFEWGLVPSWMKERPKEKPMINARLETVMEKPSFRSAWKSRRCLIPASGFFEWSGSSGAKLPYVIRLKGGTLFAFAGIWEYWTGPGGENALETTAILTTAANEQLESVHHRMPVIIKPADYARWLGEDAIDPVTLHQYLLDAPAPAFEIYPVSRKVNNTANDDPSLIEEEE